MATQKVTPIHDPRMHPMKAEEFRPNMPLVQLRESDLNPRKHYNQHKLEELAESIRTRGIITPLLARPVKGGMHEIAAGHRRFRAAKLAGLQWAPVRIMDLDDDAFLEVVSIENLQREDIHPLEEGDGYRELLRTGRYANANKDGYDVATLADKIGKTEGYVRGRLELADLVPVVRESFLRDAITIGHARLISRLDPEKQEDALRSCFQTWGNRTLIPVKDFRRQLLHNQGADLSKAPFSLDDVTLKRDAGACTTCPKCTGVQRSLLADDTGEQTCMDRGCYSQKVNAFVQRQTASGLIAISTRYPGQEIPNGVASRAEYVEVEPPETEHLDEEIASLEAELRSDQLDTQDRKQTEKQLKDTRKELAQIQAEQWECTHTEKAIVVHSFENDPIGQEKLICRNAQCQIHGPDLRSTSARGSSGGTIERSFTEIWQEKRKNLDDKIKIEARREVTRQVYENCPRKPDLASLNAIAERMRERIGHDITAELITHVLKIEAPKSKYGTGVDTYAPLKKLLADAFEDQGALWRLIVLMTITTAPSGFGGNDELKALAIAYGVNEKAITKQIGDPLIEKFNKLKANAKKKADTQPAAKKKASKPEPAKSSKMAAAGDDDDYEEGEE
jgi:ParB/RepB/Spo0J family partition protein